MTESLTPEAKVKLLRKLAAEYRRRAETEPKMARTLHNIAEEMEADAANVEASEPALSSCNRS
ncbi:MAG TPA: hypothetical protein VLM36_14295 [Sphingomicrobium sp.]|nr:hypothetical protein [Sphingomicrobium sp.]